MRTLFVALSILMSAVSNAAAATTPPYPIRLRTGDNVSQWNEMAFFIKTRNGLDYYKGGDGGQYDPDDLNKVFFWIYAARWNYRVFFANAYEADCTSRTLQRVFTSQGSNEEELNANVVAVPNAPVRRFAVGDPASIGAHYHCEPLYR